MKNIYTILAILTTLIINAQEQELPIKSTQKRHDFKIGIVKPIALNNIDLEYEYILPKIGSIGVNVSKTFSDKNLVDVKEQIDFSVSPYIRFYFSKSKRKNGSGPFLQNQLSFYKIKNIRKYEIRTETEANPNPNTEYYNFVDKYDGFGIGLGAGQKWVFNNRFIVQVFAAPSIVFLNDNDSKITGFFHGDVYLGYRLF